MRKFSVLILLGHLLLAMPALAAELPSYYPKEGFKRSGIVDSIHLSERRIVIGDIEYPLSDSPIVHTLRSYTGSIARVLPGTSIGFRLGANRTIEEIWLLPRNYNARPRP